MERTSIALACIVLAFGCGNGETGCDPGTTRPCTCEGGLSGTTTCNTEGTGWSPCDCGSTDAGTDGDVAGDAADEPDAEDVECIPGTDEGTCSVVLQCDCGPEEWCNWVPDMTACMFVEQCVTLDPGTRQPGDACDLGVFPQCRPDSICMDLGGATVCCEWCLGPEDCGVPGESCGSLGGLGIDMTGACTGTTWHFPAHYGICT